MYIIRLAWRNVWRNRRRSVLAAISVGLSLMLIVSLQGYIRGIMGSLVSNYTRSETGHIRVTTAEFERKARFSPVTENIANPQAVLDAIKSSIPARDIALVTRRTSFGVLLTHDGKSKAVAAVAGDPAAEDSLLMLKKAILKGGRYIEKPRDIIVGSKVALELGYEVGDTVPVMTQGSDYSLRLRKFAIAGIFETGISMLDDGVIQMGLADADELLRMEDRAQQILVFLRDYRGAQKAADTIRAALADTSIAVRPWTAIGDYHQMVTLTGKIYGWIYVVIGFLGAFIIGNIMTMVVLERRKEIGVMKSMGVSRREILWLFLTEGMTLGCIGSVCGAAVGVALVVFFGWYGIDLSSVTKQMAMPVDNVIRPSLLPFQPLVSILLGTFLAGIISIGPARKAASMAVVDSIKSV